MSSSIYCGNNARDVDLVSGTKTLGTRYKCLRAGVGVGLNLPVDPNYRGVYEPINKDKIYCGDKKRLPKEYDNLGTLPHCLQKGVGIGKLKKANRQSSTKSKKSSFSNEYNAPRRSFKIEIAVAIYIIVLIGIFLGLYIGKPRFIMDKDKNNILKLNKGKLFLSFILIALSITIILYRYLS